MFVTFRCFCIFSQFPPSPVVASMRRPLASLKRAKTSMRTNRDVSEGLSTSTECDSALRTVYLHVEGRKKLPVSIL